MKILVVLKLPLGATMGKAFKNFCNLAFRKKGSIEKGPFVMRRYVHLLDRAVPTLYKNIGNTLSIKIYPPRFVPFLLPSENRIIKILSVTKKNHVHLTIFCRQATCISALSPADK